jgi:hypothetical protein
MDPKRAPRISETSCGEDGVGRHRPLCSRTTARPPANRPWPRRRRPRGRRTLHAPSSAWSRRELLTARPLLRACLSGAISGFARAVFAWLFDDISL